MTRLSFFTKPDCSLCNAAMYIVERVRRRIEFDLEIIDITAPGHESWLAAYKHDIPVVHLDGIEFCRHRVDERNLFRELTRRLATK